MANIVSWSGNSPHAREVAALDRLRDGLPSDWFGYANVFVKDPKKDTGQEVDLILVCEDRVLMIDVKDWVGTVSHGRGGTWFQTAPNGKPRPMGGDPIQKLFHANNAMRSKMNLARITPTPYVMNLVMFNRKETDFSDVAHQASEGGKGRVVDVDAFIAASKNIRQLDALIGKPEFNSRPRRLTDKSGPLYQPLRNFFTVGRDFAVAETTYAGYHAKDEPVAAASLWTQYEARSEDAHGDLALLRLWDFGARAGFTIEDSDRETLVSREEGVQAFLRKHKTGSEVATLTFKQNFNDGGASRWELFQNHPDNVTLEAFLARGAEDISVEGRIDLLESLMATGAALASALVAHRDIGEHSVWIDLERRRISLSNFVAAKVPETITAGRNLPLLARSGVIEPSADEEDACETIDPLCTDVHAFAFAGLKILLGRKAREHLDDSLPIFVLSEETKAEVGIGTALSRWFETALEPEWQRRYSNCAEAHSELVAALSRDRNLGTSDPLAAHRRLTPSMQNYPQNEMIPTSRDGVMEWRTHREGRTPLRSRLWLAPSSGRDRCLLDFVRRGASLAALPPYVAPRIIECSIDAYGPFLCVEEFDGVRLSESDVQISQMGSQSFKKFAQKLARNVLTAHDIGLPHGDLPLPT